MLPKLSVTAYFDADISEIEKINDLSINIKSNGNLISKNDLSLTHLKESIEKHKQNNISIFYGVYNCNIFFVPIPEDKNTIDAEFIINGEVIYSQKLTINMI